MLFKPGFVEFFQHEFDALAAEVSKLAHEVEFEIVENVVDAEGVAGRALRRVEAVFNPAPAQASDPAPAVSGDNPEAPTQ